MSLKTDFCLRLLRWRAALSDKSRCAVILLFFALTSGSDGISAAEEKNAGKPVLPVLLYHQILRDNGSPAKADMVPLSMFEKQMQYLHDEGYRTLSLAELEEIVSGKKPIPNKVIAIHFDDEFKSALDALPVLTKYGQKASFSIVPSVVGQNGFMTWSDINKIAANPRYDILSHTMTHVCEPNLSYDGKPGANTDRVVTELTMSRNIISKAIGREVNALVWPCGSFNLASVKLATSIGYTTLFGTDGKPNVAGGSRLNVHRTTLLGFCGIKEFAKIAAEGTGINCLPQK